jgi:tetratricopeptide (TPR) repeat protein
VLEEGRPEGWGEGREPAEPDMNPTNPDYASMCFVIMPFGSKPVGKAKRFWLFWRDRVVDFDRIYREVFAPAIEATPLPEGGHLAPYRTDMNPASANIDVVMFRGIVYARMVLSDITGLNPNVFYELGVRHHSNEWGTAIFRQADGPVPFDISHIKAVPYEYQPEAVAEQSRRMITRVLTESLRQNLITSPVQVTLRDQRNQRPDVEAALKDAEDRIRAMDPEGAVAKYQEALRLAPGNPLIHFKAGLLHKYKGRWAAARDEFAEALRLLPEYAEAHRELGIAQNRLLKPDSPAGTPTGEDALRRAIELNPRDFDAHASLGGLLRRQGRLKEALEQYERATEISERHPYPLLNEVKLRAALHGRLDLTEERKFDLARAARFRLAQINNPTPLDSPWCFFDLSEIRLYLGSGEDFLKYLEEGLLQPNTRAWQAKTHRESLELLAQGGYNPPGLTEGIRKLRLAEARLPP